MNGATLYSNAMIKSLNKQWSLNYCRPNHSYTETRGFTKYHRIAEKSGRPEKLFAWIDNPIHGVECVCKSRSFLKLPANVG